MSAREPLHEKQQPVCPTCSGELRSVSHGTYGGPRLHAELYLFECPHHGHVFLTREGVAGPGPGTVDDPRGGDAPLLVPRNSPPAPGAGAVAVPEPDSN